MQAEREKAGLLPERPSEDGLAVKSGPRRPADVWLPRGTRGEAEALDFAVTSGLQAGWCRRAAEDPGSVFAHYEGDKRSTNRQTSSATNKGSSSLRWSSKHTVEVGAVPCAE